MKGIDEATVDRVERPSVVIGGSIGRSDVDCQTCPFDEAFKARVMLGVDAVELDAAGPSEGFELKKVPDHVVEREHLTQRLRHQLLAQMQADEAPGADHAYSQRLDRPSVQICSGRSLLLSPKSSSPSCMYACMSTCKVVSSQFPLERTTRNEAPV